MKSWAFEEVTAIGSKGICPHCGGTGHPIYRIWVESNKTLKKVEGLWLEHCAKTGNHTIRSKEA